MTIHRRANKAYKHQLKKDFEADESLPKTVDGLLSYLFDEDQWDDEYSDYIVYKDKQSWEGNTTLAQRLNRLWLFPLVLAYCPIGWVFTGNFGVSQHSKFGKWLANRIGL